MYLHHWDILLNGRAVDALATIVHIDNAQKIGKLLTKRLRKVIHRQQFQVAIQAAIGAKILARESISAMRKDVIMGGRSMMEQALEMYRHGWVLWFINEATGIGVPTIIREAQKRGRDRGTGNKGKVPAVDPNTGDYLIKPDGTWLSVRERDNLKKTALGRKLTVDEVAVLKGVGM